MADRLMKRAEELDEMRSLGISKKLTIEEAQNIVTVWGTFLEYSGGLSYLFGIDIPKSLLPFPIQILQGALNKMEAYYFDQGQNDRVKLLEETEAMLMRYADDSEAIKTTSDHFEDQKWQNAFIPGFKSFQENQVQNGFLVDKKLWKLSKSRLEELLGE